MSCQGPATQKVAQGAVRDLLHKGLHRGSRRMPHGQLHRNSVSDLLHTKSHRRSNILGRFFLKKKRDKSQPSDRAEIKSRPSDKRGFCSWSKRQAGGLDQSRCTSFVGPVPQRDSSAIVFVHLVYLVSTLLISPPSSDQRVNGFSIQRVATRYVSPIDSGGSGDSLQTNSRLGASWGYCNAGSTVGLGLSSWFRGINPGLILV